MHARYQVEFKRLADSHWPDNLLLLTHEYGVMSAMQLGGCSESVEATYCGFVELLRKQKATHDWSTVQYQGVYKYETLS